MKKLALDTEALRVESFPTTEVLAEVRGTVHGNGSIVRTQGYPCGPSGYTCGNPPADTTLKDGPMTTPCCV
jgi:hypothetical protein